MSRTPYLDLNIPDKSSKGFVVTDVFEPNFTKLDQEAERINLRKMSTEDNIEELKKANRYKLGDVVEVLGFHAKGDGSHHKRVAKSADDGSGEQGQNGIWWCLLGNKINFIANTTKEFLHYLTLSQKISKSILHDTFQITLSLAEGEFILDKPLLFRGVDLSNVSIIGSGVDKTTLKIRTDSTRKLMFMFQSHIGEIANMKITYTDDTATSSHVGTGIDVSYSGDSNFLTFLDVSYCSTIGRMYNVLIATKDESLIGATGINLGACGSIGLMTNVNIIGTRWGLVAYSGAKTYFGEGDGLGLNIRKSLVGINCHEAYVTGRNYNFTGDKTKESVAIENNNGQVRIKWGNIDANYVANVFLSSITSFSIQGQGSVVCDEYIKSDSMGNRVVTDLSVVNSNRSHSLDDITSLTSSFGKFGTIDYTGDGSVTRDFQIPFAKSVKIFNGDTFVECKENAEGKIYDDTDKTYQTVSFLSVGTGLNTFLRVYSSRQTASLNLPSVKYKIYYER